MVNMKIKGFTLIELLVVMSIVALLLTLSLPRYYGAVERSRETVLKENLWLLRKSIDQFYADRGRYPVSLDDLVTERYLHAVPVDPVTERADTWIPIPSSDTQEYGVADVRSGAQGATKQGTPFDQL